jgi:hypothetical protein
VQNCVGGASVPARSFRMMRGAIRAHSAHAGTSGIRMSAQYKHHASATWVGLMRSTSMPTASFASEHCIAKLFVRAAADWTKVL